MTESNSATNNNNDSTSTTPIKKDCLFWSKIIATQYLIRHPFWKSFSLPMIIGQVSANTNKDYTQSSYVSLVYILIAFSFGSGVLVSDRKFRHALGFVPHLIGIGCTSYLFYTNILQQLAAWLRIRIIIHAIGTLAAFCFISSLHTKNIPFRSTLRRLSSYLNGFYFILNAYVLWWSTDETKLFDHFLWTWFIRIHALLCFLASGGFCLDLFVKESCQLAFYLICSNIFLDSCIVLISNQASSNFWLLIDYLMDDIAMTCGCFYLYQFHLCQKTNSKKTN